MKIKSLVDLRGSVPLTKAAEMAGISKSYLCLIEKGKRRLSLDKAETLSKIYGVSVNDILKAYKASRLNKNPA